MLSFRTRLILYALAAALPLWKDFFHMSADYTWRGLAAPIVDSLYQMTITVLAKTSPSQAEEEKGKKTIDLTGSDVTVTPVNPVPDPAVK
jgi:hypothetical protein